MKRLFIDLLADEEEFLKVYGIEICYNLKGVNEVEAVILAVSLNELKKINLSDIKNMLKREISNQNKNVLIDIN